MRTGRCYDQMVMNLVLRQDVLVDVVGSMLRWFGRSIIKYHVNRLWREVLWIEFLIPSKLSQTVWNLSESENSRDSPIRISDFSEFRIDWIDLRINQILSEPFITHLLLGINKWIFHSASFRYSGGICGFTAINLTKLDVLTGLSKIKLCVKYRNKSTGNCSYWSFQQFSDFNNHEHSGAILADLEMPTLVEGYNELEPVYEELPGWTEKLDKFTHYEELPFAAQVNIYPII